MKGMAMHLFYDTPMPSDQGILNTPLIPEKIKIGKNMICEMAVDMAEVGIIMKIKLQILTLGLISGMLALQTVLKSEVLIMKFMAQLV